MANLTLELNIDSAKDLSNVNIITKMDVYAVVSIHGDETQKKQKAKTAVDRSGGSNPTWTHAAKFSLDKRLAREGRLTLVVKLICDRVLGDKDVGEVNVPVLELLNSNPPPLPSTNGDGNGMRFVAYQVRTPSGRGKGSLSFSYRFDTGPVKSDLSEPAYPNPVKADLAATAHAPLQPYPYPPPPPPGQTDSLYPDLGKLGEPLIAYPASSAGPSCGPPSAYAPPPPQPYAYPPPADKPSHAYQQAPPPQMGYAYAPPPQPSYGYGYPPPPPGYGYGCPPPPAVKPPKSNKAGLGFGAGLLGGALGGLLIGNVVSDVADFGFDF